MTVTPERVRQSLDYHDWPGKDGAIRFLAAGEYNENWLVEDSSGRYVFRLNHGSQLGLSDQIGYEYRVLKALEPCRLTPRAFAVDSHDPITNKGILLMEYLPGQTMEYRSHFLHAARLLAQIHRVGVNPEVWNLVVQNCPLADVAQESLNLLSQVPDNFHLELRTQLLHVAENLREAPPLPAATMCLVNTELNSGNFLWDGFQLRLVDWEKAVFSSPFQDLAHFLSPTTTRWKTEVEFTPQERHQFLAVYKEASEISLPLDELFQGTLLMEQAVRLRALSWCLRASYEYQQGIKPLAHASTAQKIQWYLENAHRLLSPNAQDFTR